MTTTYVDIDFNIPEECVCPICLSSINTNIDIFKTLECSHLYHLNCINTWINTKEITYPCPMCMKLYNISEDDTVVEIEVVPSSQRIDCENTFTACKFCGFLGFISFLTVILVTTVKV